VSRRWDPAEDAVLMRYAPAWPRVRRHLPHRSIRACQARWATIVTRRPPADGDRSLALTLIANAYAHGWSVRDTLAALHFSARAGEDWRGLWTEVVDRLEFPS